MTDTAQTQIIQNEHEHQFDVTSKPKLVKIFGGE